MATDAKTYLEYLDKEMTIMGILSAVAIAAPAGILNALLGDKNAFKDQLWGAGAILHSGGIGILHFGGSTLLQGKVAAGLVLRSDVSC